MTPLQGVRVLHPVKPIRSVRVLQGCSPNTFPFSSGARCTTFPFTKGASCTPFLCTRGAPQTPFPFSLHPIAPVSEINLLQCTCHIHTVLLKLLQDSITLTATIKINTTRLAYILIIEHDYNSNSIILLQTTPREKAGTAWKSPARKSSL